MIYGNERRSATGANSANLFLTAVRTAKNRGHDVAIIWDEADTGMSNALSAGAGQFLAEVSQDVPPHLRAMFIISHSSHLLEQLLEVDPYFICLGDHLEDSLEDWVNREVIPISLEDIKEVSTQRFRRVREVLSAPDEFEDDF